MLPSTHRVEMGAASYPQIIVEVALSSTPDLERRSSTAVRLSESCQGRSASSTAATLLAGGAEEFETAVPLTTTVARLAPTCLYSSHGETKQASKTAHRNSHVRARLRPEASPQSGYQVAGRGRRPGPWARPCRAGLGHRARGLCWRRTGGLALGDPAGCRWCGRDLGGRRLRP